MVSDCREKRGASRAVTVGGLDISHLDPLGADKDHFLRIYETLWRGAERENNLINQRMTWPILLSSGFITAESFLARPIIDHLYDSKMEWSSAFLCLLLICISFSGAYFSWHAKHSIDAAIEQLRYIRDYYLASLTDHNENIFQSMLYLPRPIGDEKTHLAGTEAARIFPAVLVWGWGIIAAVELLGLIRLISALLIK